MSLVRLRDVTRTVVLPDGEDLHILRGVSLDVEAGEHISIVGRSGTGKSTMLNIIGLLDAPTSGRYELDGVDTTRLSEGRRARLRGRDFGFVFQQFNIFAARTAVENVEVPLLYGSGPQLLRRRSIAVDMLERVGLAERADSYPGEMSGGEQQRIAIARALVRRHELSGGEQQRVAIARAFVNRPLVLLADEPTGALDPDTGGTVMNLLEEVARESEAALIVITHDMAVASRASRAFELYDGTVHEVSDAAALLGHADAGPSAAEADGNDGELAPPPAPPADGRGTE